MVTKLRLHVTVIDEPSLHKLFGMTCQINKKEELVKCEKEIHFKSNEINALNENKPNLF